MVQLKALTRPAAEWFDVVVDAVVVAADLDLIDVVAYLNAADVVAAAATADDADNETHNPLQETVQYPSLPFPPLNTIQTGRESFPTFVPLGECVLVGGGRGGET